MSSWTISIPHRDRAESLIDTASNCRRLDGDDRAISRSIVLDAATSGMRTAGELLDHIDSLEPDQRRAMLDHARKSVGLPTVDEVEAAQPKPLQVRRVAFGAFPSCAAEGCNAAPVRASTGAFYHPGVKRWHCDQHAHLAEPGDLEPRGSGLVLSPAGVPVEFDPASDERDRAREESRRAQLKTEAETRAVEAAELRASNRARDAAHQTELPPHLRRSPA